MPELPEDDIQRMPDADRIRNRIRERREAEQTEETTSGVKFDAPGDDPTSTNLKWNNIVDGGDSSAIKFGDIDILDPNDPDSWKVEEVKTADFADGDPATTKVDGVVDHKADDQAMKLDEPATGFEEIKVTLTDPTDPTTQDAGDPLDPSDDKYIGETEKNLDRNFNEAEQVNTVASKVGVSDSLLDKSSTKLSEQRTDGVVDHKADDVVDHKADDVDGPVVNDPLAYEETKVTFDDPITETGLDKASPKGLPVDDTADQGGDSYYEGTAATGGATDSGSDSDLTDGVFKFAVPTDQPGDSFKSVSGMEVVDEGILPTGETVMMQQTADPVGDALAPLDGGDELIDPASDSADLTAQIDGVHDDGLDDSFGA